MRSIMPVFGDFWRPRYTNKIAPSGSEASSRQIPYSGRATERSIFQERAWDYEVSYCLWFGQFFIHEVFVEPNTGICFLPERRSPRLARIVRP